MFGSEAPLPDWNRRSDRNGVSRKRASASVGVAMCAARALASHGADGRVDPAIAAATHRLENVFRSQELLELAPQAVHALAQRVAFLGAGAPPSRRRQLVHRDEPARLLKQRAQENGLE